MYFQKELAEIQAKLKVEKDNINKQNREIHEINAKKEELQNEVSSIKLKMLKDSGEQKKLAEEFEALDKAVYY